MAKLTYAHSGATSWKGENRSTHRKSGSVHCGAISWNCAQWESGYFHFHEPSREFVLDFPCCFSFIINKNTLTQWFNSILSEYRKNNIKSYVLLPEKMISKDTHFKTRLSRILLLPCFAHSGHFVKKGTKWTMLSTVTRPDFNLMVLWL